MVRTRFAPSPTGRLHVGNARIAVLNWLFARHHDGAFVLRIEDTDRERTVPGAEAGILEDLRWLGLEWDEGPGVEGPAGEGPHAPYRQSERGAIYREYAQRLVDAGIAYPCYCAPEEIEAAREAAIARGEKPHYPGTCRRLTRTAIARFEREGRRPALRCRVPEEGTIVVRDVVRGEVRFDASDVGDFILLRSDGMPTYNFAVVVDDALMEITHVIRGVGHLSNTPRQVLLYEALGFPTPIFAHAPTVLGPDRQKLSKRNGAKALSDYRREGVHPDAIVNYLSLLGWSSPSGDEFLLRQRLIGEISLERIRPTDVVFDPEKLRWLSAKHIERMSTAELADALDGFIDRERYPLPEDALPVVVEAVRSHLSCFSEINDHLDPFVPTLDAAGAARRDALREDAAARAVLRAVRARLAWLEPWDDGAIDAAIRAAGGEIGARGRALFEPLRIALTGHEHGPPLAKVAAVLGRAAVLELLDAAVADGREV
ncbi:MAG TPA: glutamate--tRNA ligase [Longimicrobiales bacterium]